ncbi:hypothetical protein BCR43DRAFT_491776 [Syncephalastrum racemosum]|uniref:Uncharacterized protein n=1 Tax=Syncephalastrum racemosum TaxID=13706 RepID=A0A1X2HDS9_SYNRA|nr:hypothetical protein BCR43DRAFT_491776 [Syncephalastrum racemosum]
MTCVYIRFFFFTRVPFFRLFLYVLLVFRLRRRGGMQSTSEEPSSGITFSHPCPRVQAGVVQPINKPTYLANVMFCLVCLCA